MSTHHHRDGLATPSQQVIPAKRLHLSLEDIYHPPHSPMLDHHPSRTPSPPPRPTIRSSVVAPEPPIPTNSSPPHRTPPGLLLDSAFTLSPQSVNLGVGLPDCHVRNSLIQSSSSSPPSSSTSGTSPGSATLFEFSPRSARAPRSEHSPFDTTLATLSNTGSISRVSKGKQRAILPDFDGETDTELENNELGEGIGSCSPQFDDCSSPCDTRNDMGMGINLAASPSWHSTPSLHVRPGLGGQREAISSGISLAMAYSKQRADPPKSVSSPIASTSSSPRLGTLHNPPPPRPRQRTNSSPSPAVSRAPTTNGISNARPLTFLDGGGSPLGFHPPRSPYSTPGAGPRRPIPSRSVSMSLKIKFTRPKEFIRSRRGKMSPSMNLEPESPSSCSSSESLRDTVLRKKGVRPHHSVAHLRSATAPPVLTNEEAGGASVEHNTADLEPVAYKRDLFDEVMPVEMRLCIFSSLVRLHVDEHQSLIDAGQWTTARANRSRWVGWEGGIRELVKLSRVSRTWQALVFDGQLWPTLGGCEALSPSLLTRISASAGPFVHSLQLEGATTLTADDTVTIASRISVVPHHARSIQLQASVPIEHWCTNVKSINLAGCCGVTTRSLHKLLASCPLLESLCLRGLSAVTNTTCIVIGDAHPQLVSLDLSRCFSLDAFGMSFICEAVDRRRLVLDITSPLKELRLCGVKRVSEWTLSSIARAFPALEVLDLSYCESLVDACLERFTEWQEDDVPVSAAEMRKRYHVSPTEDEGLTPYIELTSRQIGLDPADSTTYKRRVTRLRHLNLSHCPSLTDQACTHLAYAVPHLELLELGGIGPNLEDAGMVRLLKTAPLIRKLDLEDASRITDDVITALIPPTPIPGIQLPTPITIPGQATRPTFHKPRPIQTGERLEHLIISYAGLLTPEILGSLVRGCLNLLILEADNTRLSDSTVREFVELQRARGTRGSTLVAIDCPNVGRGLVDELAGRALTRPRAGWRGWHARKLAYADAGDGDDVSGSWGSGLDECDDRRVTLKSFRSWQVVDKWTQERAKKKSADASGSSSREGGGKSGSRWFGRRSSNPDSGANTPRSVWDDDDRGCVIM